MTVKDSSKAKPRTRPVKSKGGRSAGKSPAKSKAGKTDASKPTARKTKSPRPKVAGTTQKRLRPSELDGFVITYLREQEKSLPLGPGAVAKGIGRSSGAVGNCLERLANADDSPVRRAQKKPRAYGLRAEPGETPS